jgi:hypothetical protein
MESEETRNGIHDRSRRQGSCLGTLLAALAAAAVLAGCAHRPPPPAALPEVAGRSCQEPEELLDVLARFSTAVDKREYHRAIAMLVPEDQVRMLDKGGKVPEAIKVKLDALDPKSLAADRRVDLVRGRLKGIYDCLPCLDQGEPAVVEKTVPKPLEPPADASPEGLEKARKAMAKDFYQKIQTGRWQKASGLVHPDEWKVFLDADGNLSDLNERRLQAIEECDLDALTLEDGLLTGLVVLVEPPVSDLYLKAGDFFDLVESGRIDEAIAMILESEKKFFLDENGKLRPDRVEKLKALDRGEWRRLYLYHDVLLGVAEAAIGYENL